MPKVSRRTMLAGTGALAAGAAAAQATAATPAPQSLKGKSILITGTSSGFGRAGALLYARLGAKVFATMRNLPRPEADELLKLARAEKLDITVLPLDVRDEAQVNRTVAKAEKLAGGALDVLVNNAGVVFGGPVEVHDIEAAQLAFDTNVYGPLRTIRAALPAMRARKSGVIVNMSSQQGRFVMAGGGLYAPTKFALEAMSEQLAYEVAQFGIEVLVIQPGGYPTNVGPNRARYQDALAARIPPRHGDAYGDMVARLKAPPPDPARMQAAMAASPMGRADPEDIPRAIAEVLAMPAGTRPLRRAVHPVSRPQEPINEVSRQVQLKLAENSPMGVWVKAVLD
ncbi:SDR family oxidoreductase [Novosphingobium sp. TH158]|uniref:SDR family oxidoreductase n=1 Tax=Novosphingobium sp. TH158 TaxID=2067455 RepID=UPI000C7E4C9A|nr:SDR family oxidoreductase [Novosphingobium sp. TH158]PLK25936.1 short-chain dehydrogenase/reductase [Novosphingobium sp. TH158]